MENTKKISEVKRELNNQKYHKYIDILNKFSEFFDKKDELDIKINSAIEKWKEKNDIRTYKINEFNIDTLDYCEIMLHLSEEFNVDLFEFLPYINTLNKFKQYINIYENIPITLEILLHNIKQIIICDYYLFKSISIDVLRDFFDGIPDEKFFYNKINKLCDDYSIKLNSDDYNEIRRIYFEDKEIHLTKLSILSIKIYFILRDNDKNSIFIKNEKYSKHIKDLERRCKSANLILGDNFEWNDETIEEIESKLKGLENNIKYSKNISIIILIIFWFVFFLFGLYLFNNFTLIKYGNLNITKFIQILYFAVFPFLTIYIFLKSIYISEFKD